MLEVYALTARTRKPQPTILSTALSPLPARERMKVRVRIQRTARFRILPPVFSPLWHDTTTNRCNSRTIHLSPWRKK